MSKDRDALHAAGGNFIAQQIASEGRGSNAAHEVALIAQAANPKRVARNPRTYLDMVDDHDLVAWLHRREPKWGETFREVFEEARDAFPRMDKLNADHIRTRMERFADRLPKAHPPVVPLTLEERLAKAEKALAIIAKTLTVAEGTPPELAYLADYYNTNEQGVS